MVMEVEHLDKRFLGSVYGHGSGFAGAVWDSNSVAPTLNTMQGGGGGTATVHSGNQKDRRRNEHE